MYIVKFGRYLTNRKAEWARKEEERLRSLPDPDCPVGHIVMPENERLKTLSQLQKSIFFYQLNSRLCFLR